MLFPATPPETGAPEGVRRHRLLRPAPVTAVQDVREHGVPPGRLVTTSNPAPARLAPGLLIDTYA